MGSKTMTRKPRKDKRPPLTPVTETSTALKEATLNATGGEVGHKTVDCPRQVDGLCGGKSNSANICANTVTVLACEEDAKVSDGKTLSGEKDEAFVCNLP